MTESTGEWSEHYQTYLWRPRVPFDVKFEIERATGILLERDRRQTGQLIYRGASSIPPNRYQAQLRFEAALPQRNLYSMHVDVTAPRDWIGEADFHRGANRAFAYWTRNLQGVVDPGSLASASREIYDQRVAKTLALELALANRKEDMAPISAIQQAILDGLRRGRSFRTAHHESGMTIYFDGGQFIKQVYGVEESREIFARDDQIIAYLRAFYDWEARRNMYPHQPPELEVWRFIQRQLMA